MKKTVLSLIALCTFSTVLLAQDPDIKWQHGPVVADLGNNIAQIDLDSDYVFTGPEDTRTLMKMMGNPPSKQEMGLVAPVNEGLEWFVLFEFKPVGYVKDDEKTDIDAQALLKNITEGTEASNKKRIEMGGRPLHVVGWYEEPHYDESTHNLVWAIIAESDGDTIVNYNTRLLGRTGFTSVVIVSSVDKFNDGMKMKVEKLLGGFSYKSGKRYFEFVKGDKVAQYGLTALVAGGAGAAAVKFGLLKSLGKLWKVIVVGFLAALASLKKFFRRLFGLDKSERRELDEQVRKTEE